MTPDRFRVRAFLGLSLVVGAFGLLAIRLAWIQLVTAPSWDERAARQQYFEERTVPAERGAITDRNGQILARTEQVPSVALDPKSVKDASAVALLIERHLGVPRATTIANLAKSQAKNSRFLWVKRQVRDRASVERLRSAFESADLPPALVVREEQIRVYPHGTLAAHVLGFTDVDGKGLEGVERVCDSALAGTPGRSLTLRDASGIEILTAAQRSRPPLDGQDVRLTIDLAIQSLAEKAADEIYAQHQPDGLTVAVMDVETGEIVALAVRPLFDPARPSASKPEHRRNRFLTDAYEPGSVFKPITMAAALDAGAVSAGQTFVCNDGSVRFGGRVIHEDRRKDYGTLGLAGIIAHSSNTGIVQVVDRLGIDRTKAALAAWGFGSPTGIGWPGEQSGDIQAKKRWSRGDQLASVAFGHSMTATPAQILQAYGAMGNGGVLNSPRLILSCGPVASFTPSAPFSPNAQSLGVSADPLVSANLPSSGAAGRSDVATKPAEASRVGSGPRTVCRAATADAMLPMLEAVLAPGGTAEWVYKSRDYRIGGKTGTAQKLKTGGHVASFACLAPIESPRLAVLVMADEPRKNGFYGSTVAAKYAVPLIRGALRAMGVVPDEVRPRSVREDTAAAEPIREETAR